MARDLISLYILDKKEDNKPFNLPNTNKFTLPRHAIISYVDVDIDIYSKKSGTKTVKKNVYNTSQWLKWESRREMGIDFSKTLQDAFNKKVSV